MFSLQKSFLVVLVFLLGCQLSSSKITKNKTQSNDLPPKAPTTVIDQEEKIAEVPKSDFSFVVFGDTRMPGYMKFSKDQLPEIDTFMKANFQIENRTPVKKSVTNYYTPTFDKDGMLTRVEYIKKAKGPDATKTVVEIQDGWPHRVWSGKKADKTQPLVLRQEGQEWVYNAVLKSINDAPDKTPFALHTGDLAYNGYYNKPAATDSPYWKDFTDRFMAKLPDEAPKDLKGRFFPAVGNHETWLDSDITGLTSTVPYLEDYTVDKSHHTYTFDYLKSRFVFMDTGGIPPDDAWNDDSMPSFTDQQQWLDALLQNAAADDEIKNVFVALHKPPFCTIGHGHLQKDANPHDTLVKYSDKLNISVFSGHVHSTEMYLKDNIKYLVLGGGGANQVYDPNKCDPSDVYCQNELYWKGNARIEEYNFMTVKLEGDAVSYELRRWRPMAQKPYEKCMVNPAGQDLQIDCTQVIN